MFNELISLENLLAAWQEFLCGKRKKPDVQEFGFNLTDNIIFLHHDLANGIYRHGGYHEFKISDPKSRIIHKASVRDRLLHHAIHRILYHHFDRFFICDSFSCRLGKGTHAALSRFKRLCYKVSNNNTRTVWILKGDIRKYFASIDQQILLNIIEKYIGDMQVVSLLKKVIFSFNSGTLGKGIPLGNLTSQLFANIYLNELDHYLKRGLRVKNYIRYADDFVVVSADKEYLASLIPKIRIFLLEMLKLELHPDKLFIKTLGSGVDYLGWVHFNDHKVLRTISKKRMYHKIRLNNRNESLQSYLGLLKHGNAFKLKQNLLEYYNGNKIDK
jgi:RNA-directed DNA polymerase